MSRYDEVATCRGCRMELRGKPYYMGGSAYHPRTGEQCKVNRYGGYVCSESCDQRATKEMHGDQDSYMMHKQMFEREDKA